jgi:Ni/Fe-hydrogenase subunit HybB-like protein
MVTIGMTIAGIILSTLHQSALGAMYLLVPGKLHPLWYSSYIPVFFLSSSIYAALAMVIFVSTLAARFLRNRCDAEFLESLPKLTLGLGQGAAVGMYVYFVFKMIGIAHDNNWHYLNTPYGYWYLVEVLGFVLAPALLFTYGVKTMNVAVVRFAAIGAVVGILMNRLNTSIIALNWNLPQHLHHIIPPWTEAAVVMAIATIHILIFRQPRVQGWTGGGTLLYLAHRRKGCGRQLLEVQQLSDIHTARRHHTANQASRFGDRCGPNTCLAGMVLRGGWIERLV